jgi:hypothetical protein
MERACLVVRMVFRVGVRSVIVVEWRGVAWVLDRVERVQVTIVGEKVTVSSLELRGGSPSTRTLVTAIGWLIHTSMSRTNELYGHAVYKSTRIML